MKRRHFLALLGLLSLGGFRRLLKPSWRAEASEEHLARSVAALADLMFPGDGLPGATEVGIHRRVLEMPELRTTIELGIAWLDKHAARQGAADFVALDEARKLKDRTVFMDFRTDPTENVFPMVKAGKGITEMLLGSEDL